MDRVLIITYYWPPSGGGGVQRWLKFSKYLPEYSWTPVIYTPENPHFSVKDHSLLADIRPEIEVYRSRIWEPFKYFSALKGKEKDHGIKQGQVLEKERRSFLDRIAIWLRGNLFLPDPRVFWVKSSVRFLSQLIEEKNIKIVISTGPPHSMHLIGYALKKRAKINWVADFRDPWSNWDILSEVRTSKLALAYHRRLERKVLKNADKIITVSKHLAEDFEKLSGKKVEVVTNGVDEEDFSGLQSQKGIIDKFKVSYFGLLSELRNPRQLWEVLKEICKTDKSFEDDLQLTIGGMVSESVLAFLRKDPVLKNKLIYKDYLPHDKMLQEIKNSFLLLLLLNRSSNAKWIIPAKLFEFLYAGRPILMLGPKKSDASDILYEMKAGVSCGYDDRDCMKKAVLSYYNAFKEGKLLDCEMKGNKYTRYNLTGQLAEKLEEFR